MKNPAQGNITKKNRQIMIAIVAIWLMIVLIVSACIQGAIMQSVTIPEFVTILYLLLVFGGLAVQVGLAAYLSAKQREHSPNR